MLLKKKNTFQQIMLQVYQKFLFVKIIFLRKKLVSSTQELKLVYAYCLNAFMVIVLLNQTEIV